MLRSYDDSVGDHELAFLRTEWERLAHHAEVRATRFAEMDKRLAAYDTRFDSVDRRFDQLTTILLRMENNQLPEKAQGKAVASPSDSPDPATMSTSRSHLDHRPPGFGVPPLVFENREGMLKKLEMPVFSGSNPFGWIAQVEHYFSFWPVSWARAFADGLDEFGGSGPELV
uniref:Retrotransposon gag domain-containing protein n=1 Tax=Brassica oleracea TaxID=3712 RepID=A0A3P6E0W7_BRAOL|nr:unnamed protein product [Brassica oleracea]